MHCYCHYVCVLSWVIDNAVSFFVKMRSCLHSSLYLTIFYYICKQLLTYNVFKIHTLLFTLCDKLLHKLTFDCQTHFQWNLYQGFNSNNLNPSSLPFYSHNLLMFARFIFIHNLSSQFLYLYNYIMYTCVNSL